MIFDWLFKRKKSAPQPDLRRGDILILRDKDGSPWPTKGRWQVEIMDLKEGWVRYRFLSSSMFQDERMRLDSFLYCYQRPDAADSKSNGP